MQMYRTVPGVIVGEEFSAQLISNYFTFIKMPVAAAQIPMALAHKKPAKPPLHLHQLTCNSVTARGDERATCRRL